jgi:hypothetical protein
MKHFLILLLLLPLVSYGQGPYGTAAGQVGSTAIHKDSSVFVGWAGTCSVVRGWHDFALQDSVVTYGLEANGIGFPDNSLVSLGDGGNATVEFTGQVFNGPGPDFAVFENSFVNFIELAFVEVSSDGNTFVRFPAVCLTPDSAQVDPFGYSEPTHLYNFAGKYDGSWGTPFDLDDLADSTGIDLNAITHIRVVDVIGAINASFTTFDSEGNQVNDPYPTPYPSGGFDLDAVGLIYNNPLAIDEFELIQLAVFPNPTQALLHIQSAEPVAFQVFDLSGRMVVESLNNQARHRVDLSNLPDGFYILKATSITGIRASKTIIKN